MKEKTSTKNSKIINTSPETIYKAFADPEALAVFLAPARFIVSNGWFLFDERHVFLQSSI